MTERDAHRPAATRTTVDLHRTPQADPDGTGRQDGVECCGLWGWSPPPLPADSVAKRRVDRLLPRR
jgi:hypothetical protein